MHNPISHKYSHPTFYEYKNITYHFCIEFAIISLSIIRQVHFMKYGFIGCGNMGGAIAKAFSRTTKEFIITDRSGKAQKIAQELGCIYGTTEEIVTSCDAIFLAVKPQAMKQVLSSLVSWFQETKPLLISMAAGLSTAQIEQFAGGNIPVIRIMPNTPVAVSQGLIPYCCNDLVQQPVIDDFLSHMKYAGKMDLLPEGLMDAVSALSGSGPAFVYLFADAMADGAVACGLPRQKAIEYAAQTLMGAASMMLQSSKHPSQLKDDVCSPGGSTICGIKVLEEKGVRGAVMDCICATYNKNLELGK